MGFDSMALNKIVSFIIPAYNSERYLEKCLNSFCCDEIAELIEVLIVDDGSTDRTSEIAEMFEKEQPEVFHIIHKENGGHGSAINIGSKEVSGKYFKVVDADDWVVTENLPIYVQYLSESNAEVVLTPFHMIDMVSGERTVQKMYTEDYFHIYSPNELANNWNAFKRCASFHGITYKTAFYNRYPHELPEKVFYEDQEYSTIPFCYAKKVALLNLYLYQYLVGNSAQSVSKMNRVERIGHLDIVIDHMMSFWQKNSTDNDFERNYFLHKMEDLVLGYYVNMCILNPYKRDGRKVCCRLNQRLKGFCPELYTKVYRKYLAYKIFSILHINEESYEKIIHSSLFCSLRHNYKIEREAKK